MAGVGGWLLVLVLLLTVWNPANLALQRRGERVGPRRALHALARLSGRQARVGWNRRRGRSGPLAPPAGRGLAGEDGARALRRSRPSSVCRRASTSRRRRRARGFPPRSSSSFTTARGSSTSRPRDACATRTSVKVHVRGRSRKWVELRTPRTARTSRTYEPASDRRNQILVKGAIEVVRRREVPVGARRAVVDVLWP